MTGPSPSHPGRHRRAARPCAALAFATALGMALCAAPGVARAGPGALGRTAGAADRQAEFAEALGPHGEWVEVPRLGRAWRPSGVEEDWRPYFHGSWTWTEDGWFWVTDEPWGWATYHYGRWSFDGSYGWVWVPGDVWAPAWVTWRWNGEVIGWAPLAPAGTTPSAFWTFVPAARLVGERVEVTALPAPRVPALLLRTRPGSAEPGGRATARRLAPPLPARGRRG